MLYLSNVTLLSLLLMDALRPSGDETEENGQPTKELEGREVGGGGSPSHSESTLRPCSC